MDNSIATARDKHQSAVDDFLKSSEHMPPLERLSLALRRLPANEIRAIARMARATKRYSQE